MFALLYWVGFAFPLYSIATYKGAADPWRAFIPILNGLLTLELADRPMWWMISFIFPPALALVVLLSWMKIAQRMDQPRWITLLMLVPCLGVLVPYYIAYCGPR